MLDFTDKVVVITGAGGGLGKAYALEYASRGAKVVVNDLGGTLSGFGHDSKAADIVTEEIKNKGGQAVANYDSVTSGELVIKSAIDNFGRVDILINNAGILRDVPFKRMTEDDFSTVVDIHLNGAYRMTKAAWPYMKANRFGRIINTCSPAGLYGNFGQSNYSAAKLGLVGLGETLAKEGYKYGINVNSIAPLAKSRMTEKIIPSHVLEQLGPEKIVPLVLYLTHHDTKVTNQIFELAGGFYSQIRWERSSGQIFNPDPNTLTPEAVLHNWVAIGDFKDKTFNKVQHPNELSDYNSLIKKAKQLPLNTQGSVIIESLKNKVVIITGSKGGLGRSHALWFAKYGAKVLLNDIVSPNNLANDINRLYGPNTAFPDNHDAVSQAEYIIFTAMEKFGRVDILINNAGILRDRTFLNMTDDEWFSVLRVHLFSTFRLCKAVWTIFLKQNGGTIINTTSTSGLYGNFGQANYAAAKAAILGLSKTLAIEGAKHNINVHVVAPHAETDMTKRIFSKEELQNHFDCSQVSPFLVLLSSEELQKRYGRVTGKVFEIGGGWCGETRWQRSKGLVCLNPTPEFIKEHWSDVVDFSRNDHPSSTHESSMLILKSVSNISTTPSSLFSYNYKDVILYNLGLGCTTNELRYIYEDDPNFQVLPTFAIMPLMKHFNKIRMESLVDNFNYSMLLHGEQYFKLNQYPLPTKATLKTIAKPIKVVEKKGKVAIVVISYDTIDTDTKKSVVYNEGTFFIRDATVLKAKEIPSQLRPTFAIQRFTVPTTRVPDFQVDLKTSSNQATLYRLSGDYNPLHIDPKLAKSAGFSKPILHGLCTLGIIAKALYEKFGIYDELKARFTGVVFPGDTLRVKAWLQSKGVVIFQTTNLDTNNIVVDSAALKLVNGTSRF